MRKTAVFIFICLLSVGTYSYPGSLDEWLIANNIVIDEGYVTIEQRDWIKNFLLSHPDIQSVAEIGFNAGHSAECVLTSREDITITSFDLGKWNSVLPSYKYLEQTYPNRISLHIGDSRTVVPKFHTDYSTIRFDFIFIDGGHETEIAFQDILNMKECSHPDTFVVVDDLQYLCVLNAWSEAIQQGILAPLYIIHADGRSWGLAKYRY